MSLFREYVNPYLGEMLEYLKMDKNFKRGEGSYLYDDEGRRYLDFIAQYGALPFGFNDPDIWNAITGIRDNMEPSFVQPSALTAAGELGKLLVELAPPGIRYVTFANSGTEAVEAAIKMVRSTTGRMGIISTKNSFHGKTMGALSATGKVSYQKVFGAPISGFRTIPYGDIDALKAVLEDKTSDIAAFIVEPIQGEGGIIIPPDGYLKAAYDLCHEHNVIFVADEIQTGLGRTGELFCVNYENFTPDIILLAKALGGGIVPIGACLCTEEVFNEDFAMKHSSTFAGNTLACRVGLASMEKLVDPALMANVKARGIQLMEGLKRIWEKYPKAIREVRGKGLMIGIDFETDPYKMPLGFLSIMADQEVLTPVIASFLLNVEGLRVAPTLNGSSVIRIEPALNVTEEQCRYALNAIETVAELLSKGNAAGLFGHLIGRDDQAVRNAVNFAAPRQKPAPPTDDEGRFAFLVHPLDLQNWREFDSSLTVFNDGEILALSELVGAVTDPFVISEARIVSKDGEKAYGQFIIIPMTTKDLVDLPKQEAIEKLTKAIKLASEHGAKIVGLGAYTSVISSGGRDLIDLGVPLTTGNSYTVEAAIQATLTASKRLGSPLEEATACIVGANGSIGRPVSMLLAEKVKRLILVGNPRFPEAARRRMLGVLADTIARMVSLDPAGDPTLALQIAKLKSHPDFPGVDASKQEFVAFADKLESEDTFVKVTTDLKDALVDADIIITATNNVNTIITADMLKQGAVVCDMSRPFDVSPEVRDLRPDVLVIEGGVISLPGKPDLGWEFGFEKGEAYACMSETILLAMEKKYENISIGMELPIETIMEMRRLAEKHGFGLAGFRSFDRPLPEEAWNRVKAARELAKTACELSSETTAGTVASM